ncbi:hypothetical protein HYQ46_002334 [Verticillium longisporum]|nr:hypothetical protein HYQ46_002334 [Verticillium longisporum]
MICHNRHRSGSGAVWRLATRIQSRGFASSTGLRATPRGKVVTGIPDVWQAGVWGSNIGGGPGERDWDRWASPKMAQ